MRSRVVICSDSTPSPSRATAGPYGIFAQIRRQEPLLQDTFFFFNFKFKLKILGATLHGLRDLSSLTGDRTRVLGSESAES